MTALAPATVAIIGGGITGLAAAYRLARGGDRRVILFEASDRLGGQIRTARSDDGWVELGADSFLARDPYALDLCRELGLGEELIQPAVFAAYVWFKGRLHAMPRPTLFGVPLSLAALQGSGLLSMRGAARAAAERFNRAPLKGRDISVARFVVKRFGPEVMSRLVDPMLAGTRSGDPRRLSLAAALPEIDALARNHPSLLRAGTAIEDSPPRFYSLTGGLESLIDAVRRELAGASMQLLTPVESIAEAEDGAVTLHFARRDPLRADAAIVAVPPPAAARIVQPLQPAAASELAAIRYATGAVVTTIYDRDALADLPSGGSGVLVPSSEAGIVSACTWWSRKWPTSHKATDTEIVRSFVGRHGEIPPDDRSLAGQVHHDVAAILGIAKNPLDSSVTRWSPGLPIFEMGHLKRVAAIRVAMKEHPRVALACVPEKGSGITECIRRGEAAADQVHASLERSGR